MKKDAFIKDLDNFKKEVKRIEKFMLKETNPKVQKIYIKGIYKMIRILDKALRK